MDCAANMGVVIGFGGHVRCLVAETHERKFRDLVPRYRAISATIAEKYSSGKVSLKWI